VFSLEVVALAHIVTWYSGSGGIEVCLGGQLASFNALTLGWVIWLVKIVPYLK